MSDPNEWKMLPYRPFEETPEEWEEKNVAGVRKLCREQTRRRKIDGVKKPTAPKEEEKPQ